MSNQNRVQPGIHSGGEYAATPHAESNLALTDPAARPVILAPGESENFNELADGDVIETPDVNRSHVDDGTGYTITAAKTLNSRKFSRSKRMPPWSETAVQTRQGGDRRVAAGRPTTL